MMEPRIEWLPETKLLGLNMQMSLADDRTPLLWQQFMPLRKSISNVVSPELFAVQVYPTNFFDHFDSNAWFEKWAAVEVTDFEALPVEMKSFILQPGQYAVFNYKGLSGDGSIFNYIFNTWLPNSKYVLDDRPHFELLGEKFRRNDPESEEEIWIPVQEGYL